jgi:hypothetical protein
MQPNLTTLSIMSLGEMTFNTAVLRKKQNCIFWYSTFGTYDTQHHCNDHNDTQQNDTQQNNTQQNDTQQNDTRQNNK